MTLGGEWVVSGTAASITSIFSLPTEHRHVKQIILKVVGANDAYVGKSDVTTAANRAAVLRVADPALSLGTGDGLPLVTDNIYLVGTAAGGNIVHIFLVI